VIGIDYPAHRRAAIVKAHEEIHVALSNRDPAASEQRMREHIDAYTKYAQKKFPDLLNQTITWDRLIG
jgi:DNA-binding FadR family transcriptional regulator